MEHITPPTSAAPATRFSFRKVAAVTLGGSMLEYYNFGLYGIATALVFSGQFFPEVSPAMGIVLSLATFGTGFLAQPIGAAVFSHFGDRIGRARILFITMFMLGGATVLIGLLPNFASIGFFAPLGLVLLRMIQGFASGAEMAGSAVFGIESAPTRKRGLYGSFTAMGSGTGAVLAAVAFSVVTAVFGTDVVVEWAWRIPFLFGAVLLLFAAVARRGIVQVEARTYVQETDITAFPLREVVTGYPKAFVAATLVTAGFMSISMISGPFALSFLADNGYPSQVLLTFQLVAEVAVIPGVFLVALLSDRTNRKLVMCVGSVICTFTIATFFAVAPGSTPMAVYMLGVLKMLGAATVYGGLFAFLAEQFPRRMRYSGMGVAFALGSAIGAGSGPAAAAWIYDAWNRNEWAVIVLVVCLGAVMAVAASTLTNHTRSDANDIDRDDRTAGGSTVSSDSGESAIPTVPTTGSRP